MLFFDFVFYLLARTYQSYNEKGFVSTAAGVLGLFLSLNILAVLMTISIVTNNYFLNSLIAVGVLIFFQIVTYIRYVYKEKHSMEIMTQAWSEKPESNRRLIKVLALIYSILSLVICIGVAIYSGTLHKDI